mgnify:FL=1
MPVELKIPSVGESVTEVYIGEWRKSSGDHVEKDEEVVEIESEKATFDIPAPAAGVLAKIVKQNGETAQVGDVIALIEEGEADETPSEKLEQEKLEADDETRADHDENAANAHEDATAGSENDAEAKEEASEADDG